MRTVLSLSLAVLALAVNRAPAQEAINIAWDPITDADRETSSPVVEKEAGAEALFWKVHVLDQVRGDDLERYLYHYIRLKVFDQKGAEKVSTIDIEFGPNTSIINIVARTIKKDGSIVEMKSSAVYQRDLIRLGGRKVQVKSFALPAVEPGAIVEYRYTEVRNHPRLLYERLQMQREYPVREVTYYVKPLGRDITSYRMIRWPFNCEPSDIKLDPHNYSYFTLRNVPEFHEEPLMPAEPIVRPWVLITYRDDLKRDVDKYWGDIGRKAYNELKQALKVTDEIKAAAVEATNGAGSPEEKAAAMIRYLKGHLRNLYDPSVSDAERTKLLAKMPKDRRRTAGEVLKSGLATPDDLNLVFAAMAAHIGLEARPILISSRDDVIFDPRMVDDYFLRSIDMAVRVGDNWKVYDVSADTPPGMLVWYEEGVAALLSDPKKPIFLTSPVAAPEESTVNRTAHFALLEDGTMEGDVEEVFHGHEAPAQRDKYRGESEARRQDLLKESVTKVFPQAEVSAMAVENPENPSLPLVAKYHVRIPGYATRTSKRMLIQPFYFERGVAPRFTATERRYDVTFPYAWKERDEITIKLPAGFILDKGQTPNALSFGKVGSYDVKMTIRNQNELVASRELVFGNGGLLQMSKAGYRQIKTVFDTIQGSDNVAVTLRQGEAGAQ